MEEENNYFPNEEKQPSDNLPQPEMPKHTEKKIGVGLSVFITCIALVIAILLTWTLTSVNIKGAYSKKLQEQQNRYNELIENYQNSDSDNLSILREMIEAYSLYADNLDEDEMLSYAFKAYVEATGDVYAEYYTAEEYAELVAENNGDFCGVGITVVQSSVTYSGSDRKVYQVIEVYENSSALEFGMQSGDLVYAVKDGETWKTVDELGYTKTLQLMRGEEGTQVTFMLLRKNGENYEQNTLTLTRKKLVTHSVRTKVSATDATVGIVSISGFDLTTPTQFKAGINGLLEQGVEHFIFDVRNNPGGDLRSISAVLSYFLDSGDKIIDAINKNDKVSATYCVEACTYVGDYAGCSVAEEEIGMYKDLDFAILCNGNTASAAEVFVATLRDYREEKGFRTENIIGTQTFGKGIMQTTTSVPFSDGTVAYLKLTTHKYVTKCGVSYHGIGIEPDNNIELSEDAQKKSLSLLDETDDAQLLSAITLLKK